VVEEMMRQMFICTIVGGIAGFIGGALRNPPLIQAAASDVVRATRFEVVDPRGEVLAEIGPGPSDGVRLALRGGNAEVNLGVRATGQPVMRFLGRARKPRMVLELDENDRPSLGMGDEQWEGRMRLGYMAPDVPSRAWDKWGLTFTAPGSNRAVASLLTVKQPTGYEGLLTISGKSIR